MKEGLKVWINRLGGKIKDLKWRLNKLILYRYKETKVYNLEDQEGLIKRDLALDSRMK